MLSLVGSAAPPGRMFLSSLPIRWARSASPRFPPAIVRCASGAGDPRSVGVTTSGAGDHRSVGSHDHPRLLRRDHRSGWVSRSPVCYNLVQLPARECPFNTLYGAVWADTYFRKLYYAARFTGNLRTMLVPVPSIDATLTSPPCASTTCLTM